MNEETKNVLVESISDVGYWRWWTIDKDKDVFQIEFGGVQLYDETKNEKQSKSSIIALRFSGNGFLVFLDNLEDNTWYEKLYNDEIEPFGIENEEFIFNNTEYARKIYNEYRNKINISDNFSFELINNAKNLLCIKCNDVGLIIGGNEIQIIGSKGKYSEDEVIEKYKKWWEYWTLYWKVKETKNAFENDYVCEVTIPIKSEID